KRLWWQGAPVGPPPRPSARNRAPAESPRETPAPPARLRPRLLPAPHWLRLPVQQRRLRTRVRTSARREGGRRAPWALRAARLGGRRAPVPQARLCRQRTAGAAGGRA